MTSSSSPTLSGDFSDHEAVGDSQLMEGLRDASGNVTVKSIKACLSRSGILLNDPRLVNVVEVLKTFDQDKKLSRKELFGALQDNLSFLHRVASQELIISKFPSFCSHLDHIYELTYPDKSGENAEYIPILRDADSEKFGIAFTSVDGQFYEIGDSRDLYSVQSTSKPLTFALALEKLPTSEVLSWCGIEPSGRPFNDPTVLPDGRPYNPMVNAGALMTAAILSSAHPDLCQKDTPEGPERLYGKNLWENVVKPYWTQLSGNGIFGDIGFSEETFLSERRTADNNIGIAHFLKGGKGLPKGVGTQNMVDFYLRSCSTTNNTAGMSVVAATLANGGRNPFTGEKVLSVDNVKKTLSVLSFCGFYDNAGEFFFLTGVPSKSGVSGVVFLVLPNVGGFAMFSPRLDKYGNSVRASGFAKKLVELFTFHSFDNLTSNSTGCKMDPRFSCDFTASRRISRLRWALKAGDVKAKKFDDLLVRVCVFIALADGNVEESELEMLRQVYCEITGVGIGKSRLEKAVKAAHSGFSGGFEKMIAPHKNNVEDTHKELLLEAAFKISTADGVIAEEEEKLLTELAAALELPPVVISSKLNSWKKRIENGEDI